MFVSRLISVREPETDIVHHPPGIRTRLNHLTVLYPGEKSYGIAERVTVVPFSVVAKGDMSALFPLSCRKKP